MKLFLISIVGLLLIGLGLALGYFLARREKAPEALPPMPQHHNVGKSGHVDCVKFSPQDAVAVIEEEFRHPTIDMIKHYVTHFDSIEIVGSPKDRIWYYQIHAYVNKDESRLWKFGVDHWFGTIGEIWPINDALPKSKALEIARLAFKEKTHPYIKECGPPANAKIELLKNDGVYYSDGIWHFSFKAEGQDGVWGISIDSKGTIQRVARTVP
jgi:hypothetical protein